MLLQGHSRRAAPVVEEVVQLAEVAQPEMVTGLEQFEQKKYHINVLMGLYPLM